MLKKKHFNHLTITEFSQIPVSADIYDDVDIRIIISLYCIDASKSDETIRINAFSLIDVIVINLAPFCPCEESEMFS